MTNLTNQRRLASRIMKVGHNRVWIDPQRIEDVESAITREEVRKLVHEKVIAATPIQGVSRGRAKVIQAQETSRSPKRSRQQKRYSPCNNYLRKMLG